MVPPASFPGGSLQRWFAVFLGIGIFQSHWKETQGMAVRRFVLITGSTDGIGTTTTREILRNHPELDVFIHGRNQQRIDKIRDNLLPLSSASQLETTEDNRQQRVWTLPPSDLSTIRGATQLAIDVSSMMTHIQQETKEQTILTVLMHNAGVYSPDYIVTQDGLEQTFAVNVLAPFIVTSHLLPLLLPNVQADHYSDRDASIVQRRIVVASSISQGSSIADWDNLCRKSSPSSYRGHQAYSESKLLDAMLTIEMADRLQQAGYSSSHITCNCLDPGTVNTKMLLDGWGRIGMEVEDAKDEAYLCTSPDVTAATGQYFVGRRNRRASASAYDPREREKLWQLCQQLEPDAADLWKFDW